MKLSLQYWVFDSDIIAGTYRVIQIIYYANGNNQFEADAIFGRIN